MIEWIEIETRVATWFRSKNHFIKKKKKEKKKNLFSQTMLNWFSLSSELRYELKKVLGNQACLAVVGLLRIIGLHLKNYLLNKSTKINTQK